MASEYIRTVTVPDLGGNSIKYFDHKHLGPLQDSNQKPKLQRHSCSSSIELLSMASEYIRTVTVPDLGGNSIKYYDHKHLGPLQDSNPKPKLQRPPCSSSIGPLSMASENIRTATVPDLGGNSIKYFDHKHLGPLKD